MKNAKCGLKVGIIGIGAIGQVHADAYKAAGIGLAAVCDVDRTRLAEQCDRLGVRDRFTDYRKLLKTDIDAVSICVGNALHCRVAIDSLAAGRHILLEKPMAMNAAEASRILAAGRKARRVIQIGMVQRQRDSVQLARDYVARGMLGEIYHARTVLIRRRGIPGLGGWFTTRKMSGGGPLIDLGVHWFDAAMHISGLWKPTSVSAMCYAKFGTPMRNYVYDSMWAGPPRYDGVFDVEDYATGLVRFGRKATLSFEIAWAANSEDSAFVEVIGDKGGIRVLDGQPFTLLTEFNGKVANVKLNCDDSGNPFHEQARKFAAACSGRSAPAASPEEGLTVMKLIDAVYASSRQGREISIR